MVVVVEGSAVVGLLEMSCHAVTRRKVGWERGRGEKEG